MKQKFKLGGSVYQITYCSFYSDKGYSYRKTYIKAIYTIQELGETDKIQYITALDKEQDTYMSYLDIVKTEREAKEKLKELQNEYKSKM